jgi:hypothetical protein
VVLQTRSDDLDEFEERNKEIFEVFSPSQALFSLARGVFTAAFLLRIHRLVLNDGDEKEIATSFYSKSIDVQYNDKQQMITTTTTTANEKSIFVDKIVFELLY